MENFQKIDLYKRREFGDKIGATIAFIRQNAASFFKAQLFISGPAAIVAAILYVLLFRGVFDNLGQGVSNPNPFTPSYFLNMLGIMVCYLVLYASIYLVTFSFLKLYHQSDDGEVSVNDVFQLVMSRLGAAILAIIVIGVMVTVGVIFFLIPGIYLGVVCALVFPIMVFENESPFTAISRAFTLIKEKWWSTFGLIVVMLIISYVLMMIILMPIYLIGGFGIFAGLSGGEDVLANGEQGGFITGITVLVSVVNYIGAIIGGSVVQLALGYQYGNLVEMKESRGLMSEIEKIGSTEESASDQGEY